MSELTIAHVSIRRDEAGRYCLNDLHRAAGGAMHHQPAKFFANKGTQELVDELRGASPNSENPLKVVNDGRNNGTWVAKELVYAYAMWISAAFHLKVIRAYDAMMTAPAQPVGPAIPQTLPEALRLAADLAEQKAEAEAKLAIAAPKADALDRITASDEAVTFTQAAKVLGVKRETLTNWMHSNSWIYRQNGSWVAYQAQIECGRLQYKEARYTDERTHQECIRPYCHIMPKGLTKLAEALGQRVAA